MRQQYLLKKRNAKLARKSLDLSADKENKVPNFCTPKQMSPLAPIKAQEFYINNITNNIICDKKPQQ